MKKKVALFGGTFNPIHLGHTQVASEVLRLLPEIDEIWFMPCKDKSLNSTGFTNSPMLPGRKEMIELAIQGNPKFKLFTYEIDNKLPWTYETLKALKNDPDYINVEFSYIIGGDQARDFASWVRHLELLDMIRFIVVPRAGEDCSMSSLRKNPHIYLLGAATSAVSSTMIRDKVDAGVKYDHLVDQKVYDYIVKNNDPWKINKIPPMV